VEDFNSRKKAQKAQKRREKISRKDAKGTTNEREENTNDPRMDADIRGWGKEVKDER
jgi:hypothetical protein